MQNYTMGLTIQDHNWVSMIFSYRGDAVTTYFLRTDGQTDGWRDGYRWSLTSGAKIFFYFFFLIQFDSFKVK